MTRALAVLLLFAALPAAAPAFAQSSSAEFVGGYAGFVDDATIDHAVIGGSARFALSPRLSVGPELVYMRGPGDDRDLFLTGNVTFDLIARRPDRPVIPFLVIGGGVLRHSNRVGAFAFSSNEGALTGGGGVRVRVNDRVFVLGEVRLGWEPHLRVNGGAGVNW